MTAAYLVQYGLSAFVGRFVADGVPPLARGTRALVRGPRGVELGTVLCPADARPSAFGGGDLLRPATPDDEAAAERALAEGRACLDLARERAAAAGLTLDLIDAEVSLDGLTVVLHGLAWDACDATALFEDLSARFGRTVCLLDVARLPTERDSAPAEPAGCGKPGCGSAGGGCSSCGTGGGCSTGSCASGRVKTAGELTAYFADLRRKMEADDARRIPLA